MQHRDGYGNEHDRNEVSQEEQDWASREHEQYYGELTWDRDDEVEDDEVEQEDADHHQSEDNSEEFEGESETDHQEDFGADDKADSTYTDIHFRYRKRARGKIEGKKWAPPSSKGLHTPQFVRLQDLQSQKPAKALAVEMDASDGQ